MTQGYKQSRQTVASTIRALIRVDSVIVKDDEVEAGLRLLEAGGDFADGVHAYAGACVDPDSAIFASFDKKAVRLLSGLGQRASLPEALPLRQE